MFNQNLHLVRQIDTRTSVIFNINIFLTRSVNNLYDIVDQNFLGFQIAPLRGFPEATIKIDTWIV